MADSNADVDMAAGGAAVDNAGADTAADEAKETLTPLYGGAMRAFIPAGFLDVSNLRDVPDHQEVFVNNDTDCSVIVELNARSDDVSDERIARHLFEDLAEYNSASASSVVLDSDMPADSCPHFSEAAPKRGLIGTQTVSKYNEGAEAGNIVRILMVVIRLVEQETDVTLMMNVPVEVAATSCSFKVMTELADTDAMAAEFLKLVKSFRIDDMSLFV